MSVHSTYAFSKVTIRNGTSMELNVMALEPVKPCKKKNDIGLNTFYKSMYDEKEKHLSPKITFS